ncbi:DUF397 domain-containing protein [Streptomyces cucumeris]|uniref:DUF397 domain-containing protein n=1 Tax=Streptomyces cucumeris TaxID=2962890 RepID=UPI0020C85A24|nr:DUF397 domain-containing protein [Streptomyces sp. NEAU-Y11]MCP9212453.1 DUF397 domain-containing protein [Streptomyces sp. NEAU-Y11]
MSSTEGDWFKSSYSGGGGGECIEVAIDPAVVRIRDSKDVAGGSLVVTHDAWTAFTAFAKEPR